LGSFSGGFASLAGRHLGGPSLPAFSAALPTPCHRNRIFAVVEMPSFASSFIHNRGGKAIQIGWLL